jgi:hypothetical protein
MQSVEEVRDKFRKDLAVANGYTIEEDEDKAPAEQPEDEDE